MDELTLLRNEIDEFMAHHPQSPIGHDKRPDFEGLNYYEPNEKLVLEVEVERFPNDEPIVVMETNTGEQREYQRWGKITFEIRFLT